MKVRVLKVNDRLTIVINDSNVNLDYKINNNNKEFILKIKK